MSLSSVKGLVIPQNCWTYTWETLHVVFPSSMTPLSFAPFKVPALALNLFKLYIIVSPAGRATIPDLLTIM